MKEKPCNPQDCLLGLWFSGVGINNRAYVIKQCEKNSAENQTEIWTWDSVVFPCISLRGVVNKDNRGQVRKEEHWFQLIFLPVQSELLNTHNHYVTPKKNKEYNKNILKKNLFPSERAVKCYTVILRSGL